MLSKMTLVGLNNFSDGHLWDDLILPEGYDKEIIVNEILRQGGEFPVLYSDYNYLKYQIGIWGKKFYHNFERWYKAFCFEYEALYNLDVKSTITEATKDIDNDLRYRLANRNGLSGQKQDQINQAINQASKAAFDADTFKPINSESTSSSTSLSTSEGHSESESSSESNSHSYEHSQTTTEVRQGNQGITMSQEMLLAEYNAWRANIYEMIGELFVSEFCICIYQ